MKVVFAICSEGVAVDRYTNKLSIFSVVESIASLSFPFWIPRLCVSVAAARDERDQDVVTSKLVILLNESKIGESDALLPFQPDGTARVVLNLNLAVPAPGVLKLRLDSSDQSHDLFQILITQLQTPEMPANAMPGVHQLTDAPIPQNG